MKVKMSRQPTFKPVTIEIVCENIRDLQEMQVRLHLSHGDLKRVRRDGIEKMGGNASFAGIKQIRGDIHNVLGTNSLFDWGNERD